MARSVIVGRIVGRGGELAALDRFLQSVAAGPRALVVEGDAGIGKSTLWMAGVDLAGERGMRVLSSRPTKAEQDLAFAGLGDLLEGVIAELLPSLTAARRRALEVALLLGETDDRVDPRTLGVAVRDVLALLAADCPLVLAVDDVQWLDGSSASALGFAIRRLEGPLAVLLARRVEPGRDASALEAASAFGSLSYVRVGALSPEAIQAVIRTNLERTFAQPILRRIHAAVAGNPFLALELARALGDDVDPTLPLPVPVSLDELMAARLAGLPDETRLGLGLVAAAGELSSTLLRAAGVEWTELGRAFAANVLESTGSAVRFSHPLLASTYYGRLTATRRREIHRQLAGLVSEPVERARHLAVATDTFDGGISAMLDEAAGSASARGAISAAVGLREHALRLTPPDASDDLHRRTIALARAHLSSGNDSRARELARALGENASAGPRRAEALLLRYEVEGLADSRWIGLLREALGETGTDPALRVRINHLLGWDLRYVEDIDAAAPHAEAALAAAEELGDDEVLAPALAVAGASRLHLGQPAAELIERVYTLAPILNDLTVRADVAGFLLTTVMATRDLDRYRNILQPLCDELTERAEWLANDALWALAVVECFAGRFHLAADLASRAGELESLYRLELADISARYLDALVAVHRGHLGEARIAATHALDRAREVSPWWIPNCETVAGVAALWSGDAAEACAHFGAAEQANDTNGSRDPGFHRWRPHFAEALLALGRVDEAAALLDSWLQDAAPLGRYWVLAEIGRCRGLAAAAVGDLATADRLLAQAAAEHVHTSDAFDRARALLDLGIVRRRARQKRPSREAIELSISIFDECGADGWAAKARAELGTLSGRTRQSGLSAAERRVSTLAAAGRTNREIAAELYLSERTVETHLSHAYTKLGVRSRTELARAIQPDP